MPTSFRRVEDTAFAILPRSSWKQKKPKTSKAMTVKSSLRTTRLSSAFVQSLVAIILVDVNSSFSGSYFSLPDKVDQKEGKHQPMID